VMSLSVPRLRERQTDIPNLATEFLQQFAQEFARPLVRFTDAAMQQLVAHPWPGNVRQLRNTIERAALLSEGDTIGPADLGQGSSAPPAPVHTVAPAPGTPDALDLGDRSLRAVEEALIRRVLEDCGGNRSESARILGINRTTLYSKLRRFEIGEQQDAANPK
jgi:DNA-binding NtrC family response regulator